MTELVDKAEAYIAHFGQRYIPQSFEPYAALEWPAKDDEEEKVWKPVQQLIEDGPHTPEELDVLKTSAASEIMTEDQVVRYQNLVDLEAKLFVVTALLIEALKNSDEIDGILKLRAVRAIFAVELIILQLGLMLVDDIASNRLVRWGGLIFLNNNYVVDEEKRDAEVARVLTALCTSVSNATVEKLASKKLGAVFLAVMENRIEPSFVDIGNFACVVSTKPIGWFEVCYKFLEAVDKNRYHLQVCLNILMRSFKEDVASHREREELKRLIALVRTKRAHGKNAPGAKAVSAVMQMLEKRHMFGGVQKEQGDNL